VKSRVPIWKQERYVQGDAGWLHRALSGFPNRDSR
jgi:molybdopterin synthase catalytic subunit